MSNKNHKNHVNYSKISTTPAIVDLETAPVDRFDGIVSGCKKLNIRKEPSRTGEIICEVSEGTTLMIDPSEANDDWFKVYTEAGVEGYCMKNFVTINT